MDKKQIMLGNEAVARGLYEAGCSFVSSYPGTPSTEITENAAAYEEIYAEWASNEKVALECALGASLAGARSFCGMKHVGLNVAADPLFISSYIGINGGIVIAVADDPGMHSSQNEQDSRHYAIAAKIPMLEPADSSECLSYTKLAYELSEQFETPVLLRLSTRVSHSQSIVSLSERSEVPMKEYVKDPARYVMMPGNARVRHTVVEKRLQAIEQYADTSAVNRVEMHDTSIGIITAGIAYCYAKEAFGNHASYLKLGMVYPLPSKLIQSFAKKVDRVIVIEELDDIIETACKKLGIQTDGKNLLSLCSEYSADLLKEKLLGQSPVFTPYDGSVPNRPPVMCPGCPHRGLFYTLKKMKLTVCGDIGCYTLGAVPPLGAIDSTFCMGASVTTLHGFTKVRPENANKTVAVIGDSTFMHSGITGLVNITYNKGISTVLILDNSITGMTGHQHNPCTGFTLKGEAVTGILPEKICEAAGVDPDHIRITDPNNVKKLEAILKEELAYPAPSVIIVRRPCALLKYVKKDKLCIINKDACRNCKSCMAIGCPAISMSADGKPEVNSTLCTGCELCARMCRCNAIETKAK
ncbi:MAG TPA: indolepyruvate ferredoxin oxidoreductase subunit alpha [Clostridiales bacterium]|nr:indolepyruvate ferredoxin oxidoreductase subunit alpha [Clostridiales bacterium]HCG35670.1 indolepyruvate ferredoxin oxidoreductase subunit alpha [Clostridiales bacterium]